MMTLKDLLDQRGHKFDKEIHCPCSDHWKGYMTGWHNAYRDIREILEYNGFDMNLIAIPEVSPRNVPSLCSCYFKGE